MSRHNRNSKNKPVPSTMPTWEPPPRGKRINWFNSIASFGALMGVAMTAFPRDLYIRIIGVLVFAGGSVWMIYRSYWSYGWPRAAKRSLTIVFMTLVAYLAFTQFRDQWNLEHTPQVPYDSAYEVLMNKHNQPLQIVNPSVVDNSGPAIIKNSGGTVGSESVTSSSVNTDPKDPSDSGFVHVAEGSKIGRIDVRNAHYCGPASWDTFLNCVDANSGNSRAIEADIKTFNGTFESCNTSLINTENEIRSHVQDEHATVLKLRSLRPPCLLQGKASQ